MPLTMTQLTELRKNIVGQMLRRLHIGGPSTQGLEDIVSEPHGTQQLDRMLSFRGDPWLYEFRTALKRMEEGTYGICSLCKEPIPLDKLQLHPTARVCDSCVRELQLGRFSV